MSKSPAPTDLVGIQVRPRTFLRGSVRRELTFVRLLQESTNVWVDHCTFTSSLDVDKDFYGASDGPFLPRAASLTVPHALADGQLDITHAADFVTVSHNIFQQAWKTSYVRSLSYLSNEPDSQMARAAWSATRTTTAPRIRVTFASRTMATTSSTSTRVFRPCASCVVCPLDPRRPVRPSVRV